MMSFSRLLSASLSFSAFILLSTSSTLTSLSVAAVSGAYSVYRVLPVADYDSVFEVNGFDYQAAEAARALPGVPSNASAFGAGASQFGAGVDSADASSSAGSPQPLSLYFGDQSAASAASARVLAAGGTGAQTRFASQPIFGKQHDFPGAGGAGTTDGSSAGGDVDAAGGVEGGATDTGAAGKAAYTGSGVEDAAGGASVIPFQTQNGAAKQPLYRQLPSQVAPVQHLPTVTNYRYIQQPIKQPRVIDQPIQQKRHIVQPVFVGRIVYQPIVRDIAEQTVIQPQIIHGTTITPHVTEQPVVQKQYHSQTTYQQGYQQTQSINPTQTQQATQTVEPAQTLKPHPQASQTQAAGAGTR